MRSVARSALVFGLAIAGCADDEEPSGDGSDGGVTTMGDAPGATPGAADDDADDDAPGSGSAGDDGPQDSTGDAANDDAATSDDDTTTGPMLPPMPSPGCGATPSTIMDGTIDVDGLERQFILDLPADYDPSTPYPFVFALHGLTENMNTAEERYQIVTEWQGQAIGIYPDAVNNPQFDAPGWFIDAESIDLDFFDALWATAREQLCIDESRVFAQGFSRGGMFSHTLACVRPEVIRAIAAGGARLDPPMCEAPVAVWLMHASNDELVPFTSGVAARDVWLEMNGCGDTTVPWEPEPMCVQYEGCDPDAPVVWCETDMGHWWMVEWQNPAVLAFFQAQPSQL